MELRTWNHDARLLRVHVLHLAVLQVGAHRHVQHQVLLQVEGRLQAVAHRVHKVVHQIVRVQTDLEPSVQHQIVRVQIVRGVEGRIVLVQRVLVFPRLPVTEAVAPFHREPQWGDRRTQRVFAHELLNH